MLSSIQPPVAPLPTETPGLLQIAWTVRFAVLKGLENPSAKAKTAFPKHFFPCLVPGHSCPAAFSRQEWPGLAPGSSAGKTKEEVRPWPGFLGTEREEVL